MSTITRGGGSRTTLKPRLVESHHQTLLLGAFNRGRRAFVELEGRFGRLTPRCAVFLFLRDTVIIFYCCVLNFTRGLRGSGPLMGLRGG